MRLGSATVLGAPLELDMVQSTTQAEFGHCPSITLTRPIFGYRWIFDPIWLQTRISRMECARMRI